MKPYRTFWQKLKIATKYLLNKQVEEKGFAFTSHIKFDKNYKGGMIFVATNVKINEVNDYWLEDTRIMDYGSGKEKREMFAGSLEEVAVFNRPLSKKEKRALLKLK